MEASAVYHCICCAQFHFASYVVEARKVAAFYTVDGISRFSLEEHLKDAGFLAHGRLWCCSSCRKSVDQGRVPPMAARNCLATPWATSTNSSLTGLSNAERQVLSEWHPFQKVRMCITIAIIVVILNCSVSRLSTCMRMSPGELPR